MSHWFLNRQKRIVIAIKISVIRIYINCFLEESCDATPPEPIAPAPAKKGNIQGAQTILIIYLNVE